MSNFNNRMLLTLKYDKKKREKKEKRKRQKWIWQKILSKTNTEK